LIDFVSHKVVVTVLGGEDEEEPNGHPDKGIDCENVIPFVLTV